jgi:hypothetical protein
VTRRKLTEAVQAAIQSLEHGKNAWIPVVMWSTAKWWLLLLATTDVSLMAIASSIMALAQVRKASVMAVIAADAAIIVGFAALVYWRA